MNVEIMSWTKKRIKRKYRKYERKETNINKYFTEKKMADNEAHVESR